MPTVYFDHTERLSLWVNGVNIWTDAPALHVELFSDSVPLDGNTDLQALTPNAFSGYGIATATVNTTVQDSLGNPGMAVPSSLFAGNGGGTDELSYGAMFRNKDNGNVIFAFNFEAPITLGPTGSYVEVGCTMFAAPPEAAVLVVSL